MKKFFTLCAALATMLSVEAAPQFVKVTNCAIKPVLGKQLSEHVGQKPAKMAKATTLRQHSLNASLAMPRHAKAEAYEYSYDTMEYSVYETDTWFKITTSDNAYKFYIDILCTEDEIELGKVYTMADCDPSYTYLSNNDTYAMTDFSEVAVVFSQAEDQNVVLDANCTTVDGDTYHLYYKPLVYPESFTEVTVSELKLGFKNFTQTMGVFQFTGENDEYDLAFCFESEGTIEGHWTTADTFEGLNNYTYLYIDGQEVKLCDVDLQVASLGGNDYSLDGKLYGYDGNVYLVKQDYVEPTVKNTAEIVATNLELDDSMFDLYQMLFGYGLYSISASNDEYTISGTLISYTDIAGHYTDADHKVDALNITDAEGNKTSVFSGDFNVENDGSGWTIKGTMLGWNSTEYTVDLSFTIPEVSGLASFTSEAGELYDFCGELGAFQVWAEDEETQFSIVLDANQVATGKYTEPSAEFADFCSIATAEGTRPIYNCDFDLTFDGETFTMTGSCQAGELLYTINISGEYFPEEIEKDPYDATEEDGDVDAAYTLDEIYDFEISAEEGVAYISVENEERMDSWACLFFIDGDELPAGEYPINDSYAPGTVQPGLIYGNDLYPTMYFTYDEEGYVNVPVWYCTTGTVTVSYDEDGNISLECESLNSNGVRVHVTVNAPEPTGIKEVAAQSLQDGKFMVKNAIVIRSNGNEYNAFGQMSK